MCCDLMVIVFEITKNQKSVGMNTTYPLNCFRRRKNNLQFLGFLEYGLVGTRVIIPPQSLLYGVNTYLNLAHARMYVYWLSHRLHCHYVTYPSFPPTPWGLVSMGLVPLARATLLALSDVIYTFQACERQPRPLELCHYTCTRCSIYVLACQCYPCTLDALGPFHTQPRSTWKWLSGGFHTQTPLKFHRFWDDRYRVVLTLLI